MKNKLLALFASLGMSGFAFGDIQITKMLLSKDSSTHPTKIQIAMQRQYRFHWTKLKSTSF